MTENTPAKARKVSTFAHLLTLNNRVLAANIKPWRCDTLPHLTQYTDMVKECIPELKDFVKKKLPGRKKKHTPSRMLPSIGLTCVIDGSKVTFQITLTGKVMIFATTCTDDEAIGLLIQKMRDVSVEFEPSNLVDED